ncbi:tRNA pseudouridine13 synthase [Alteromonadaceae bacterium 2753L.S.0a.02]|nr:tRNA pseudouridine13 synthase [Alteromonadaceae bacterium 2753L.S.0a.02]
MTTESHSAEKSSSVVAPEVPDFDLNFNFAYGAPSFHAKFRSEVDDFVVDEDLPAPLSGSGEHLCLKILKRGENTGWVAEQLAKLFGIRPVDVGFCGLKDRHAKTTQWFSLHLPKPSDEHEHFLGNLAERLDAQVEVLEVTRHNKKLRRGGHQANRFVITLRDVADVEAQKPKLEQISAMGVPNYFGEQRFGNQGSNLYWAYRWMSLGETIRNRGKKVMAQSAARSWLFNRVLSARVADATWALERFDEPATGPLWGRGRPVVSAQLAEFEQGILQEWSNWQHVLEHAGLSQERRALVLLPQKMTWEIEGDKLVLGFALPPGTFATAVLRELCVLDNQSAPALPQ